MKAQPNSRSTQLSFAMTNNGATLTTGLDLSTLENHLWKACTVRKMRKHTGLQRFPLRPPPPYRRHQQGKEKLVLVASRSIFSLFSPDEATFANAQLWKSLLRRTCTTLLWEGAFEAIMCRYGATPLPP